MRDPQATIGFNTKSWSNDLDDLRAPHGCETSKNGVPIGKIHRFYRSEN